MKNYVLTKKDSESNMQDENTTTLPSPPCCFLSAKVNFSQSLNVFSQTLPNKEYSKTINSLKMR